MARFEIDGKEYELKLTYKAVKYLDGLHEGGALALVGRALQGDLDTFTNVVHAGLLHTGENFAKEKVELALEEAFEAEKLDYETVHKTVNEVLLDSFFYRKIVANLKAQNPEAFEQLDKLLTTTE
ncbi:tail assembly chaperone [Robertmurraya sp. DFI.2.37]|uniref:tail assembly chaperone n=1 Tax=Robertmurraya sp. DFI.2.37 TaxID=3031819 RepID=UPI0012457DD3|nr:tail assembly chaperone [Robertmurraya sp. DFI.2.37]MDF1510767.1 tail assembly chaperone [Robertmurraya sp. DFI.2.37]